MYLRLTIIYILSIFFAFLISLTIVGRDIILFFKELKLLVTHSLFMKKHFLFAFCFLLSAFEFAYANSPVVQVVSYKEPLGMYFSLQGWGSGSIIDNQ